METSGQRFESWEDAECMGESEVLWTCGLVSGTGKDCRVWGRALANQEVDVSSVFSSSASSGGRGGGVELSCHVDEVAGCLCGQWFAYMLSALFLLLTFTWA